MNSYIPLILYSIGHNIGSIGQSWDIKRREWYGPSGVLLTSDIWNSAVEWMCIILTSCVSVELFYSISTGKNERDNMIHDFRSEVSGRNSDLMWVQPKKLKWCNFLKSLAKLSRHDFHIIGTKQDGANNINFAATWSVVHFVKICRASKWEVFIVYLIILIKQQLSSVTLSTQKQLITQDTTEFSKQYSSLHEVIFLLILTMIICLQMGPCNLFRSQCISFTFQGMR